MLPGQDMWVLRCAILLACGVGVSKSHLSLGHVPSPDCIRTSAHGDVRCRIGLGSVASSNAGEVLKNAL